MEKEIIEKAHQVGDTNSKGEIWVEYQPGKFDWRKQNNPAVQKYLSQRGGSGAAPTSTSSASAASSASQGAPAKTEDKYDAPKPKITYATKKPEDGIVYEVPKEWKGKDASGKVVTQLRSKYREAYVKLDDAKLLKILNNENNKHEIRQLAYEEAMARGIPEDKINVSGTLQQQWDRLKLKKDVLSPENKKQLSDEELEDYDDSALEGFDADKFFEEKFDGGKDTGWLDPDNEIIKKEFDGLRTLSARRKYDAFVDYIKRKDPMYETPKEVMQSLARKLSFFIDSKSGSPLMIAAGGAGAGKTFTFNQVADISGMTRFDPKKNQPGDGNYDYFVMPADIEDDKDFMRILSKHNGKLIVFDDKDKALVSNANKIISTMKAIADGDPKMRVFENPDNKESEIFTGKLLFLTNKNQETLNKDEDHKAIASRARIDDIHFTINENLELLKSRYKTMGARMESVDKPEEDKIRETLYQLILTNRDKLDPMKFNVRKFTKMLEAVDATIAANKKIEDNEAAAELFGGQKKDWKREAVQVLNKGEEDIDIEKGKPIDILEVTPEMAKKYIAFHKKNLAMFNELYGEEFIKVLKKKYAGKKAEDEEDDVTKALFNDIEGMSLTEAENMLFNL